MRSPTWKAPGVCWRACGAARTRSAVSCASAGARIEAGIGAYLDLDAGFCVPLFHFLAADAHFHHGALPRTRAAVEAGLAEVDRHGELLYRAELLRVHGDVLQQEGDMHGAEAMYREALAMAGCIGARSSTLRAMVSLCRLPGSLGAGREIGGRLRSLLGNLEEGLDSPDRLTALAVVRAFDDA